MKVVPILFGLVAILCLALALQVATDPGYGPTYPIWEAESAKPVQTHEELRAESSRAPVAAQPAPTEIAPKAPEPAPVEAEIDTLVKARAVSDGLRAKLTLYESELFELRKKLAECDPTGSSGVFERLANEEHLTVEQRKAVRTVLSDYPVILNPGEATAIANFRPTDDMDKELIELLGGPGRILHDMSANDVQLLAQRRGPEFMAEYLGIVQPEPK